MNRKPTIIATDIAAAELIQNQWLARNNNIEMLELSAVNFQ